MVAILVGGGALAMAHAPAARRGNCQAPPAQTLLQTGTARQTLGQRLAQHS
jgi:hypothetical protein